VAITLKVPAGLAAAAAAAPGNAGMINPAGWSPFGATQEPGDVQIKQFLQERLERFAGGFLGRGAQESEDAKAIVDGLAMQDHTPAGKVCYTGCHGALLLLSVFGETSIAKEVTVRYCPS
jgi:hypothetical protein